MDFFFKWCYIVRPLTLRFHLRTFLNFIVGKLFKRRPRLSSSWKATSTKSSLVGGGGGWSSAAATAVDAVVVKTEEKNMRTLILVHI